MREGNRSIGNRVGKDQSKHGRKKTQLKELDGELKRAKDDARNVERELQSLKELNAEANDERERFSRLINAKNNHLDALRGSRLDVLKNASMELLDIPRVAQLAAGSGAKTKKSSSRKRKSSSVTRKKMKKKTLWTWTRRKASTIRTKITP